MAIKHAKLDLFYCRDLHGNKIKEEIERSSGYVWSIESCQSYPNLKNIPGEGHISTKDSDHAYVLRPRCKSCSITKQGKIISGEWIMADHDNKLIRLTHFSC